jgi:hypothetical protein
MQEAVESHLAAWESFYVIVGSSGAALTGLQFVVMTLVAESSRRRSPETISAFGSPTILHFCAVLFLAGVLSAPWRGLTGPSLTLAASGIAGIAYAAIVARRARRQTDYRPVLEDWLFHAVLPALAYAMVLLAGALLTRDARDALFVVGAASLLLLFVGIHNAWDTVAYLVVGEPQAADEPDKSAPSPS